MSDAMCWEFGRLIEQVRSVCEITPDGCWLWRYGAWKDRGLSDERPYPRLMIAGERKPVMRWVLEASGKPQPPGMEPCHSCDRPQCVNPDHLHWDTHQANMAEMSSRRRSGPQRYPQRVPRGEGHWMRQSPDRIKRGPRQGNYASGDNHWTRRNPDDLSWRGEAHHMAKLNPEKVRDIRARAAAGERAPAIARHYGVERAAITAILSGRTWKHVA